MKVYIGQQEVEIEGMHILPEIKKEMKRHGIIALMPLFKNEEKAKEFCGDKYLTMDRK